MARGTRRAIIVAAIASGLGLGAAAIAIARTPVPLCDWLANPVASYRLAQGEVPHPVRLVRPPASPLSAMARLGRRIFFDTSLSASGTMSCASCHNPRHAYGPAGRGPVALGGPAATTPGRRAVPSLEYLETEPNFSIGPDNAENEHVNLARLAATGARAKRVKKTARDTQTTAANMVPQGGLFWDGRANTLQQQTYGPLLGPFEMDGGSIARVAEKLRAAAYADRFTALFGPNIFVSARLAVAEAMSAVARYEVESPRFHPFTSKFDDWLEGKVRFTPAEIRGWRLYNNPDKGDCGACHVDQPSPDHRPPLFTDHQYEALGVPRNKHIAANDNPGYFDLGICGPYRTDMRGQTRYCGMFLTPTLRNVATRHVFFHNGVDHTLKQVLDFYDYRDTEPARIYPRGPDGKVEKFNDLPRKYRNNIDRTDPPLNRHPGEAPALTPAQEDDIIAFLKTLTDGYRSPSPARAETASSHPRAPGA